MQHCSCHMQTFLHGCICFMQQIWQYDIAETSHFQKSRQSGIESLTTRGATSILLIVCNSTPDCLHFCEHDMAHFLHFIFAACNKQCDFQRSHERNVALVWCCFVAIKNPHVYDCLTSWKYTKYEKWDWKLWTDLLYLFFHLSHNEKTRRAINFKLQNMFPADRWKDFKCAIVIIVAWLWIPSGILENSREFPISDPFLTQFLPIPIPVLVPIGIVVPAKY